MSSNSSIRSRAPSALVQDRVAHDLPAPGTWWEASQACEQQGGALASIHSKLENNFIMTLTLGLSSWIGYQDIDQVPALRAGLRSRDVRKD